MANFVFSPLSLIYRTRFSTADVYIFDITANSSSYIVSGSQNEIKLYDRQTLNNTRVLPFHKEPITKIKSQGDFYLISSSKDGRIAFWDLRVANEPSIVYQATHAEPLLSFDVNFSETLLAAGTELVAEDAKIIFWDIRASSIITEFTESHSDDVTNLQFHPISASRLLTGAEDGIVCNYDISNFDEDEALVSVINSESTVHKAGYFGPQGEYVYCLTHTETFGLWSIESDALCNFGDVRSFSSHGVCSIDYIIDCYYNNNTQRLYLLGGSNGGDISIIHVVVDELQFCQVLKGGHTEVVRSICWDPEINTLLSGGEDSMLSLWATI
ncbi:2128_t:CDS:2 [Paraglomus brasilianum]|uniref:2128_t:CDS:1 n=1 Tax=Paraglomus brasilianum TaxID=144538 RepID=A0A9N9CPA1_9GLOM|nr:2128_t:CDS:2 [Paraglomus brasilianum]